MADKKNVLIGIDDFKKLRDLNGYYIDKSELIMGLIDKPNEVTLFSRPRRFGKTLNMSMLKYFFEVTEGRQFEADKEDAKGIFEGLKVFEGERYRGYQGKYPVVYMTFKNAKQTTWEETVGNLKKVISEEYRRHSYLLDRNIMDETQALRYKNIMYIYEEDYTDCIQNLTQYLTKYYSEKCIVIIDEYDTPIQAGYLEGYYDEVIEFIKSIFQKGLKNNPNLKQAVVTGIMKVAQESVFSDFNNPTISTILSAQYSESFGFTKEEVNEMTKYYNIEDKMEGIIDWYDGYIFGLDTSIYNPWSIINYISCSENGFKPYWVNTSSNRLIKEVIQLDKKEGKEVIEKLLKGEEIRKVIEENIIYQNIKSHPNVAWSFLLHAGYLKACDKGYDEFGESYEYSLKIPNREVTKIYRNMLKEWFEDEVKLSLDIKALISALEEKNIEKFEDSLQYIYLKYISYNDIKVEKLRYAEQEERQENFHHGFMLGFMIYAEADYEIYSNREYGFGRPDITLISKDREKAFVFEFKWGSVNGKKTLEELNVEAEKQIKDKKYIDGVKAIYGVKEVVGISIGFRGKELKISYV